MVVMWTVLVVGRTEAHVAPHVCPLLHFMSTCLRVSVCPFVLIMALDNWPLTSRRKVAPWPWTDPCGTFSLDTPLLPPAPSCSLSHHLFLLQLPALFTVTSRLYLYCCTQAVPLPLLLLFFSSHPLSFIGLIFINLIYPYVPLHTQTHFSIVVHCG